MSHTDSFSTVCIHSDDGFGSTADVAPPVHVSTTFCYPDDQLSPKPAGDPHTTHFYSRHSAPTTTRLEAALSAILGGPSVTYSSGLAAFHALLVRVNPRRLIIFNCYHGCLDVALMHSRISGMEVLRSVPCSYQSGDLVHLETPNNPTGMATPIETLAATLHSAGAELCVDSTFAPPPLQNPFLQGADYVVHSATKYLGGHSDLLGGVVAVKSEDVARQLLYERSFLGSVMGSLESWLELRSLRTLPLRIERASLNATALALWLKSLLPHPVVRSVTHASLQPQDPWLAAQMPGGYGPVFSLTLHTESMARSLPSLLRLFRHATSLGGVESLVEWRAMSDRECDRRLIRVSVGVEAIEDLKRDLQIAIAEVARLPAHKQ